MKHRLRKYERKQARKLKKQNRGFSSKEEDVKIIKENEEERIIEKKKAKVLKKKKSSGKDEDYEAIQIEREIEELESKLGLRKTKTKEREKNWKKIKKQLEIDGLGADFYDLLEGRVENEEDQVSISPVSEQEIELVEPSDDLNDDFNEESEESSDVDKEKN